MTPPRRYTYPLVRLQRPSLRPDLPAEHRAQAGSRMPRSGTGACAGAQRPGRREHGAMLWRVGIAQRSRGQGGKSLSIAYRALDHGWEVQGASGLAALFGVFRGMLYIQAQKAA